ncbi:hypothetical protein [Salinigranum marinum]|uniref:hypothetical protein n=1 Tax=Salinigranum marinum TaxID=1515595 RepID=UPI002989E8CC|nr:hypothetical protein [Salinigranum marinum]
MELHHEWVSILKEYGLDEQPARNVAAMVSGDPGLANEEIRREEEFIETIRTAQQLFNQFDLQRLGVDEKSVPELKQKLIHTLFLDLLFRSVAGESGEMSERSPQVTTRRSIVRSADGMDVSEAIETIERIADRLVHNNESLSRNDSESPHEIRLNDFRESENRVQPSADELFEYLDSLNLSEDLIVTVMSDLIDSSGR